MHHLLFGFVLTMAIVAGAGCEQIKTQENPNIDAEAPTDSKNVATNQPMADNEHLLLLGDEFPLLVDNSPNAGPWADNSRCFVCHVNYMQDVLAASHAGANIGCKDCHGESDAHIADESWASGGTGTPPEVMYPRAKINPACMACHPKDKIGTEEHQSVVAGTGAEQVCTDCHGNHRLTHRRCKWK